MIYLTADTHGEYERFNSREMRKLKSGDTLIVCGDFGFIWNGDSAEEKILKKLGKKKYRILFLDGAHENYDLLERYPISEWNGGKVREIRPNLYHLLRGQVYNIEGKKIFVFGGGESTEKQFRMEVGKWWEREMPTMEEIQEGAENLKAAGKKVDYIITHTPPPRMRAGSSEFPESAKNQLEAFFEQITKHVSYEKWFFGSLHIDRKVTYKHYAVFQQVLPAWVNRPKHHFRK